MGNQKLNWSSLITVTDTNYAMFSLFESVRKIRWSGHASLSSSDMSAAAILPRTSHTPKGSQSSSASAQQSSKKNIRHQNTNSQVTFWHPMSNHTCSSAHVVAIITTSVFNDTGVGHQNDQQLFRLPFWWNLWISMFIPCPGAPSPWFCVKRHSTDPAWLVMMRTWRHVAFHVTFQRWNPTFFGSFWMKYDELILLNSKTN